jgi:hypothetical protein
LLPDPLAFQRHFATVIDRPVDGPMAVYRNTVLHGAVEALRGNFPVVEALVGAEMFERIAVDYAAECPPRRPVLALYGDRFAGWLDRQDWLGDLTYLPDVARVERLHVECLTAADAEPLGAAQIREMLRAGKTRLRLHPATRFEWLRTPAMTIWLAHQRPIATAIEPEWKAEGALFARPGPFVLHAPRIGQAAHRILFGVRIGEPLDVALAAAARLYPSEDSTAVLASLVNLGVFASTDPERMFS